MLEAVWQKHGCNAPRTTDAASDLRAQANPPMSPSPSSRAGHVMRAGLRGATFAVLTVVMAGLLARHLVETGQSVARLARAGLETSATTAARAADAALDRFSDRAGRITAADLRGDRLALTARLLHMQIALPGLREVFAATATGTLTAASEPLPGTVPDLAARGWFQRAIAAPDGQVGLALAAPGWSHDGTMTILTYPVRNTAGAVVGVVGGLAVPGWGTQLLARAPLSQGARLRLRTPDGAILAAAASRAGETGPSGWRSVPAEMLARFALRAVPARLTVAVPLHGAAAGLAAEMSRTAAWAVYWPLLRGGVAGAGLEFLALWAVFGVLLLRRPAAPRRPAPASAAAPVPAMPAPAVAPPPALPDRAEAAETALAEARRALAATKREQETALAAIGHDMRTPMQSVLGICDLLLDGALEDEPRRWVEQLRASATALLALLNGLLAIAGGGGTAIEAADLTELLQGAASLFNAEAAQRGIGLALRIDPALGGDWSVDAARLRQVVVNLLANAITRTTEGEVTLEATAEPDGMGLRISVSDTGPGIAAADHERIFLRNERADDRVPGLGLGLALCRDAAGAMGGALTLESSPGQGARFALTCPAERIPDDARRHAFAGRAALIVGLPEAQRGALAVRLEALGFAVESAPDGYVGLALAERAVARSGVLDVVVLDLALCGMAPEAFCLRLRGSGFGRTVALVGLVDEGGIRPEGLDAAVRRGASAGEVTNQVARLLAEQPALSALLPAGATGGGGGRVLVVEDDATNRALIGAALARHGFTVFPAAAGEEALRMAEHDGLDAVLLDLMLPGIDGIETARRIRALPGRASVIPLIALTARAGEGTEAECRAAGITAVLGKPTDLDQLAQRLRGWIASSPRGSALPEGLSPAAGASPVAQVSEPFLEAMVGEIGLERTRACVQEFLDEAAGKTVRLAELVAGFETAAILRICDDLKGLADLFGAVGFSETIEELGAATDSAAPAEATRLMGVLEAGMPLLPDAMWATLGGIERRRAERGRRAA